jgi:glycerophosphoryl diester phosphodiesterase
MSPLSGLVDWKLREATTMTLIVAGATGYGVWPANTLKGARHCLAAPVDGIEIDVQLTADGHVVAHHDYWLSRHATRLDGQWLEARGPALNTLTLEDLRRYDVGTLRPGSSYAERYPARAPMDGVRIPTLPQLLDLLKSADGPRRLIYVEIKTDPQDPEASPDPAAITNAVIDDLDAAGWREHAKIIAFDWAVLRLANARAPDIATAHLTVPAAMADQVKLLANGESPWVDGCDPLRFGGSELAAIKAHGGVEWSPHLADVTAERLAEAKALGLRVGPWGVSSAADIGRMADAGVWSVTVSGPDWGPGTSDQ